MSWPVRLYRSLLWLYPADHRQAYAELMLQHAADLARDASPSNGRWGSFRPAALAFALVQDGLANAAREHWEVLMNTKRQIQPASWLVVLLACLPGLWIALSRRSADSLETFLTIFGLLVAAVLVVGVPVAWVRQRRFPVWALIPTGFLTWFAVYMAATFLSTWLGLAALDRRWTDLSAVLTMLQFLLALILFPLLLRGKRLSSTAWLVLGLILVVNALAALYYTADRLGQVPLMEGLVNYFLASSIGPIEGLFLVALGLLAARRHALLAILLVVGGFGYSLVDSDYLFSGYMDNWPLFGAYLIAMSVLYLVITPLAALRARSRLGLALAIFLPLGLFHVVRVIVPFAFGPDGRFPVGDAVWSLNCLLSLALAWTLYDPLPASPIARPAIGEGHDSPPIFEL